jgi:Bacterial extracellular solute-binding proteins, family 5 Middle
LSYEELAFHVEDSASFRAFACLPLAWSPKKSVLHQTISAIRPQTWEAINRVVLASAKQDKLESGATVRIDSTVTAALIYEPSDSALLWDAVRLMTRLLRQAAALPGAPALHWRDRRRLAWTDEQKRSPRGWVPARSTPSTLLECRQCSASELGRGRRMGNDSDLTRRDVFAAALGLAAGAPRMAFAAAPNGQLTWGIHVSLAPTWFDPAETQALITPFMVLYALHDAMVKPMPDSSQAPCLAESWSAAEDGLSYEFVLRRGAKFHNDEPVTAEDVRFSFERYRGASHELMHDLVAAIETPDPLRVHFKLRKPWPDFLSFYSSATGAGWVVPKKYVEQVGEEGFKRVPIGAGPYKFVSFDPGVELVLEAFDGYWRKTPNVKRLVMKVMPDEATRLAALKRGEIDIAY